MVVAHNHPSGVAEPSAQDRDITVRVAAAGKVLGVQLLDHIVVTDRGYASLAELDVLPRFERSIMALASR